MVASLELRLSVTTSDDPPGCVVRGAMVVGYQRHLASFSWLSCVQSPSCLPGINFQFSMSNVIQLFSYSVNKGNVSWLACTIGRCSSVHKYMSVVKEAEL